MLQGLPDLVDLAVLHFSQLKAIALPYMRDNLHDYLLDLLKLPRLEFLEAPSATRPPHETETRLLTLEANLCWAGESHSSRPFMLAMSRIEGMPENPANARSHARSHAWFQQQCRHRAAVVECLEQGFGPQDRHDLVHEIKVTMLHYFPMRHQDLMDIRKDKYNETIEIIYCNALSRQLANQVMNREPLEAVCRSENQSGWAPRKVKCMQTIGDCQRCHGYQPASSLLWA